MYYIVKFVSVDTPGQMSKTALMRWRTPIVFWIFWCTHFWKKNRFHQTSPLPRLLCPPFHHVHCSDLFPLYSVLCTSPTVPLLPADRWKIIRYKTYSRRRRNKYLLSRYQYIHSDDTTWKSIVFFLNFLHNRYSYTTTMAKFIHFVMVLYV